MAQGGGLSGTGKLRQFMCIEYPGLVKNVDKMLETLGGVEKISEVRLIPLLLWEMDVGRLM